MDNPFPAVVFSFGVGVLLALLIVSFDFEHFRMMAIKNNAAEWVLDQNTGKTTFVWKSEIKNIIAP